MTPRPALLTLLALLPSLALLPTAAADEEADEPIQLDIDFATIQAATELEQAGDVPGALAALDAAIAGRPADATLIASRGAVLLQSGDIEGARAEFDRAVQANSDDPSGFAGRCWFAIHDGKQGLADSACSAARTRNLEDPIYRQVGVTSGMLTSDSNPAAAATLDTLVNANPFVPALRLVSLEANLRAERYGQAKVDLQMARQMYQPAQGPPRIIDRLAAYRLADLVGIDMDCFLSNAALTIAQGEGREPDLATLERMARCRPDDPSHAEKVVEHHNREGLAARGKGEYAAAVEHFRAALALRPDDPVLWTNLAVSAFEGQDLETAEEGLARVLELTPDDAEARKNYGVVLMMLGREDEARPYLEGAKAP